MPPGGNRGSIAVVFVACVVVELEALDAPVVPAVLLPVVAAAELDVDALFVVWLLDVDAID